MLLKTLHYQIYFFSREHTLRQKIRHHIDYQAKVVEVRTKYRLDTEAKGSIGI